MMQTFTFNHFAENCHLVFDGDTKQCAIIDPGCVVQAEVNQIVDYVAINNLKVKYILLTHPHTDHFCGAVEVCKIFDLPLTLHKDAKEVLELFANRAGELGFNPIDISRLTLNTVSYEDKLYLGNMEISLLDTCGHAQGSISYYIKDLKAVFVGDAVFNGSIGRTDLYGGDLDLLLGNIRKNILTLEPDTTIFSGHGPNTSVDFEGANNPFINNYYNDFE